MSEQSFAAGQYRAKRDQQQFMQIVARIILPGINDFSKAGNELSHPLILRLQ
jgi:hypothetical protein